MSEEKKTYQNLNHEERRIIDLVRQLRYGELTVMIKDGKPLRVEVKESISLKENA